MAKNPPSGKGRREDRAKKGEGENESRRQSKNQIKSKRDRERARGAERGFERGCRAVDQHRGGAPVCGH